MSTKFKKLATSEIERAFGEGSEPAIRQILSTQQAADLIGIAPKTLNEWKNAGLLEGSYRQRNRRDFFWRDRLVACLFNGHDWNERSFKRQKEKTK